MSGQWAKDAAERILVTVIQMVLAAALTAFTESIRGTDPVTLDALTGAILAAYAAGLAALKAWVAKLVPGTVSPASFAKG